MESSMQTGSQKTTVTIEIDGANKESPRDTTPRAVKLLVKPPEQAGSYDLQQITPSGQVIKTYRAATQDEEPIKVHEHERFQLLPNGAPFS